MSASKRAEEKEQSMSDSVALHAEMWRFQHTGSSCTVFVMVRLRQCWEVSGPFAVMWEGVGWGGALLSAHQEARKRQEDEGSSHECR